MKIYIDVTNLLDTNYLTGIQRVVREVVIRMIRNQKQELVLLYYHDFFNQFLKVDTQGFYAWFYEGLGEHDDMFTSDRIYVDDLKPGDVFFDLDGTWSLSVKRSVLLPKLKENGVKIAVYFYDMIPVTHPQFCHSYTVNNFISYVGAFLQYADLIFASTESTIEEVRALEKRLQLPEIPAYATWLGSDFKISDKKEEAVQEKAVQAAGIGKYVLMVGTIEPRKNHAYILRAFEEELFSKGIGLIFAGRVGWNVQEFVTMLKEHPMMGKQLFLLDDMNDASIDYLYKHAFLIAFPTYNEGFGLPMIEAFERGVPVLASDIPVLKEVGGDTGKYFSLNSTKSFINAVNTWLEQPEEYQLQVEKVKQYRPVTWDEVAEGISERLNTLEMSLPYPVPETVKQMVYLTARAEDLLRSLPFVEAYMPYIKELVLLCPDSTKQEMEQQYHGGLKLMYLTDPEILKGRALPEDHAMRNFFLRCLAMESEILDDVFIMSDDDYRPLCPVKQEVFLEHGRYKGYYCYHYRNWTGSQMKPTSFDQSMYRTRDFLREQGYPALMYDSHQPQIIDKRVFRELLSKHSGIEEQGLSDWSIYFNYLGAMYSSQLIIKPYMTVSWPGNAWDWPMEVQPQEYLFENYYSELYEEAAVYAGLSPDYHPKIQQENVEKIVRYENQVMKYRQAEAVFQAYQANYEMIYGEYPYFELRFDKEECMIHLPRYLVICEDEFTRIPFYIKSDRKEDTFTLAYQFYDVSDKELYAEPLSEVATGLYRLDLPIRGTLGGVKLKLCITIIYHGKEYKRYSMLSVMRQKKL